jgi:hypothetical protein
MVDPRVPVEVHFLSQSGSNGDSLEVAVAEAIGRIWLQGSVLQGDRWASAGQIHLSLADPDRSPRQQSCRGSRYISFGPPGCGVRS